jgi:hypothetical protein
MAYTRANYRQEKSISLYTILFHLGQDHGYCRQDAPGIVFTYNATIKASTQTIDAMSAEGPRKNKRCLYNFKQINQFLPI